MQQWSSSSYVATLARRAVLAPSPSSFLSWCTHNDFQQHLWKINNYVNDSVKLIQEWMQNVYLRVHILTHVWNSEVSLVFNSTKHYCMSSASHTTQLIWVVLLANNYRTTFSLTNICSWAARRSHDLIHCVIPVHEEGREGRIRASYRDAISLILKFRQTCRFTKIVCCRFEACW